MRVGCGFFLIFARTPQNAAANNTGRKNHRTRHPGKVRGTKDQTTGRGIHALTRDFSTLTHDFSTLTREKYHGSSQPDPHETRISRVTRIVARRVRSGQDVSKFSRVGSGRVGSGRVGSGRDVSKFSRVGLGQPTRPVKSPGTFAPSPLFY